jgi:hypothetical protein
MKRKLTAIILGFCVAHTLIVALELFFFTVKHYRTPPSLNQAGTPFPDKHSLKTSFRQLVPLKLQIHEGNELLHSSPEVRIYPANFYRHSDGLTVASEGRFTAWAVNPSNGEELYRTQLTTGPKGFRKIDQKGGRKEYLILLGDTLIFGIGVNDWETIPTAIAKAQNKFKVYDFSVNGYGLGDHLLRSRRDKFEELLQEKKGLIIYLYRNNHFTALKGSFQYVGTGAHNRLFFAPGNDNTPELLGTFEKVDPIKTMAARLMARSWTAHFFYLDWYFNTDSNFHEFFADTVLELKKNYLKQFPNSRFTFVVSPGEERYVPLILPALDRRGIEVLDYSEFRLFNYIGGPMRISGDSQYTPEANRVWGEQLARDLLLNFK